VVNDVDKVDPPCCPYCLVLGGAPQAATAALEWATWGPPSGNTGLGVFSNGQQLTLAANFGDITAGVPAGGEFTSSRPLPGRPDDTNPSFQRTTSGLKGAS
jgi:hypothetical protein